MLGTIYEWFYDYVLCIRPIEDAYRTWMLKPCFRAEFDYVEGEFESPTASISSVSIDASRQDGKATVEVRVPTGTVCQVILPGETSEIEIRREPADQVRVSRGKIAELRQGSYILEITP